MYNVHFLKLCSVYTIALMVKVVHSIKNKTIQCSSLNILETDEDKEDGRSNMRCMWLMSMGHLSVFLRILPFLCQFVRLSIELLWLHHFGNDILHIRIFLLSMCAFHRLLVTSSTTGLALASSL